MTTILVILAVVSYLNDNTGLAFFLLILALLFHNRNDRT
jgi:hypothetical protein